MLYGKLLKVLNFTSRKFPDEEWQPYIG